VRMNTQEAVLSAYIASTGTRTPREAAQDAAELCRLATLLSHLNEIACNCGLTERQERRKQNLQTRIKAVLESAGLVFNHFNSAPRGYAVYLDLPDGSYNSFGGRECGYGTNHGPNGQPDARSAFLRSPRRRDLLFSSGSRPKLWISPGTCAVVVKPGSIFLGSSLLCELCALPFVSSVLNLLFSTPPKP
jgi:hypothetical protein